MSSAPIESRDDDLGLRVARLRKRAIWLMIAADLLLIPIGIFSLKTYTFRIPLEKATWIFPLMFGFVLAFNLLELVLVYRLTNPILALHRFLVSQPSKPELQRRVDFFWNRLTRIPLRTGLSSFILIMAMAEIVLAFFTWTGNIYSFQFWTASVLIAWISSVIAFALYLTMRAFLEPYYALMAREHRLAWSGPRLTLVYKVVGAMFFLNVVPLLFMVLVASRNAQFGVREYILTEARGRVAAAVAAVAKGNDAAGPKGLWGQEPPEWFLLDSDGRKRGTVAPPPLPRDGEEGLQVLPTGDVNRVWVVGRAPAGQWVGIKVALSFWYPQMNKLLRIMIVSAAMVAIGSLVIAFLMGKSFATPVREMRDIASRLAAGDALENVHLGGISDDEIGELALAYSRLFERIRGQYQTIHALLAEIRESVTILSKAGDEMMTASTRQARNVEAQVSLVQDTAESSRRFTDAANLISERAREVWKGATATLDSCGAGISSIRAIGAEIVRSGEEVSRLKDRMDELRLVSQEIRKMLEVIEKIADQTELLALNASLEAVGSGEHARRFAVVAGEVKRLADTSADSAGEIKSRTRAIIDQLTRVIAWTDLVAEQVLKSKDRVLGFETSLTSLSVLAQQTTRIAEAIVESADLQNRDAGKLQADLAAVQAISREVNQGASQVQSAVARLRKLTDQLKDRSA